MKHFYCNGWKRSHNNIYNSNNTYISSVNQDVVKSSDVAVINLSDCDCACGPLIGSSMIVRITYFIRLIYRLTFPSRNIPNPSIWLQLKVRVSSL